MLKFEIEKVKAREIIDWRGIPTIEVEVVTKGGILGRACAPSGKSVGAYESVEIRDGGLRYNGMGVLTAVRNVNEVLAPKLKGMNVTSQKEIDELIIRIDGTENKRNIGGNAAIATSLAVAHAAAKALDIPPYRYICKLVGVDVSNKIPTPLFVAIHGGKVIGENDLEFEDFMIVPIEVQSFSESIRVSAEILYFVRELLEKRYGKVAIRGISPGGTFVPPMESEKEALDVITNAIEERGYQKAVAIGLDVAASNFYDEISERYILRGESKSSEELLDYYKELVSSYPIVYIEDPFEENDFEGFAKINRELNIQVVGDDLFATNLHRLKKGIEMNAANTILFKVNQIGTLTEALDVAKLATNSGYKITVSIRSGEAENNLLADIAVGINASQIKLGALDKSYFICNRLLRILEDEDKRY